MNDGNRGQGGVRELLVSGGPFRRLLVAQAISSLGDWVGTFAFIAAVLRLTGSPLAVGGVLVIRLLPPLFAAPVGGVLADRLDRRLIMVTTNLGSAALIAAVPFVNLAGVYILAFASETILLLFLPARDATVPDVVPERSLAQANGLVLASAYGAIPVGAALFSGLRLASAHVPDWVPFGAALTERPLIIPFFFDAATFVLAAAMLARMPVGRKPEREPLKVATGVAEAFQFAWRHPGLRALAVGTGVAMFGGGALFSLGIAYVRETLGGNDVEFGFLASLWGVGMALGIGAVRLLHDREEGWMFQGAVSTCGGILIGMAFLPFTWLALIAALLFGLSFSMALILAVTLVQRMATERIRGRLLGGAQMLFRGGLAAGALGIGGAASAFGELGPLDGNQFGLLLGGTVILLGSVAAKGVIGYHKEPDAPEGGVTSPGDPPETVPG